MSAAKYVPHDFEEQIKRKLKLEYIIRQIYLRSAHMGGNGYQLMM